MNAGSKWNKRRGPQCRSCVHCNTKEWTCDLTHYGYQLKKPANFRDIDICDVACRRYKKRGARNGAD